MEEEEAKKISFLRLRLIHCCVKLPHVLAVSLAISFLTINKNVSAAAFGVRVLICFCKLANN